MKIIWRKSSLLKPDYIVAAKVSFKNKEIIVPGVAKCLNEDPSDLYRFLSRGRADI